MTSEEGGGEEDEGEEGEEGEGEEDDGNDEEAEPTPPPEDSDEHPKNDAA